MKEIFFVLFSILLIQLLMARKVRDGYPLPPGGYELRVGTPTEAKPIDGIPVSLNDCNKLFAGINVTYIMVDQPKIGEVMNGTVCTYDGMIGDIQRNKVDMFTQFVRPDSTPCEPGHFLTFSQLDDSPKIYSMRGKPKDPTEMDILYLWTNFSVSTWLYLLAALIICSVLFVAISNLLMESSSGTDEWGEPLESAFGDGASLRLFLSTFWNYFLLFLDQSATIILPYRSSITLWTSIVLAFYYAFHIVLLGTLSTDLTVPVSSRTLDTLQDLLYDPEFNSTQPVIFRQLNMYSVLKNSRKGTDERVLFDKIIRTQPESIKFFAISQAQEALQGILKMIGEAAYGKIAIIDNSQIITPGLIHGGCQFDPVLAASIKPSEDVISRSVLSILISKDVPSSVRNFIQFKILSTDESALLQASIQTLSKTALVTMANIPLSTKGMICGEVLDKTYKWSLELSWQVLGLDPFMRLIKICFGIVTMSTFILFAEHFKFDVDKLLKRKRIPKIFVHHVNVH